MLGFFPAEINLKSKLLPELQFVQSHHTETNPDSRSLKPSSYV